MITKSELKVLFPNLEEGLYDAILENAEIKEVPAGTALLKVGQNIRSTMMVIDGTVKLYQEDEEGDEYFMYYISPGQACAVSMVCSFQAEQSQVLAKAMTDVTLFVAFKQNKVKC